MEYLKEVGLRISTLRKGLKITQDELAQKVGYTSRSSVNKIEKGLVDIPQSKLIEIADALNSTPAYIMGWEEKPTAEDDELSENKKKLIKFATDVPEDKVDLVLKVMQSIVEAD